MRRLISLSHHRDSSRTLLLLTFLSLRCSNFCYDKFWGSYYTCCDTCSTYFTIYETCYDNCTVTDAETMADQLLLTDFDAITDLPSAQAEIDRLQQILLSPTATSQLAATSTPKDLALSPVWAAGLCVAAAFVGVVHGSR